MSKDNRLSLNQIQNEIESTRQKRDDLNKKTKEYINNLQEIEKEIVDTLKHAKNTHKKKRDYFNEKVKKLKEKKIEFKNLLNKLSEEIKELQTSKKNEGKSMGYSSIKQLEHKIENYERIIETENLDIAQENAIIDKIRELAKIKQDFLSEQQNSRLFKLEQQIEIVKLNLSKIYEQLTKWSNKSQSYHQKMLDSYQEVNQLREKKRTMEEELIENKKRADSYHEQYLLFLNQKKKISKGKKRRPYDKTKTRKRPKQFTPRKNQKDVEMLEKIKQDKLATALEKQKKGQKLNLYEARLILENRS